MAQSKQPLYPTEDQIIANIARALSHSARIKILKQLAKQSPCCVQVIAEEHPISKEALSNHFKILSDTGHLNGYERLPYTFYYLEENTIFNNLQQLINFLNQLKSLPGSQL